MTLVVGNHVERPHRSHLTSTPSSNWVRSLSIYARPSGPNPSVLTNGRPPNRPGELGSIARFSPATPDHPPRITRRPRWVRSSTFRRPDVSLGRLPGRLFPHATRLSKSRQPRIIQLNFTTFNATPGNLSPESHDCGCVARFGGQTRSKISKTEQGVEDDQAFSAPVPPPSRTARTLRPAEPDRLNRRAVVS